MRDSLFLLCWLHRLFSLSLGPSHSGWGLWARWTHVSGSKLDRMVGNFCQSLSAESWRRIFNQASTLWLPCLLGRIMRSVSLSSSFLGSLQVLGEWILPSSFLQVLLFSDNLLLFLLPLRLPFSLPQEVSWLLDAALGFATPIYLPLAQLLLFRSNLNFRNLGHKVCIFRLRKWGNRFCLGRECFHSVFINFFLFFSL